MTEIDGIRLNSPAFALTVSDAMLPDQTEERLEILAMLSEATGRLQFIRVRDDAMDPGMFAETAVSAASLGLGMILESDIPSNLLAVAEVLPGRRPLLMSPNGNQKEIIGIAASLGCPVSISCPISEELPGLLLLASGLGCEDIVIDPCAVSMKGCLESTVRTARMMGSGDISEAPIMCRGWSGEYALSMASVSVLSGGTLAILDDLDIQSCRVLGMLMDNIRPAYFRGCWSVKDITARRFPLLVHITRFSRIDTVSWPGEYLSVVRLSDGEGAGENVAEVANIIRGDKDSIDAVMLVPEGGDIESVPGIHHLIREFRPPTTHLIVVTSGSDPKALDDLIGAGYVDRVAFRFTDVPNADQQRSMEVAMRQGAGMCVCPVLDSTKMGSDDVLRIADMSAGHSEFILLTPSDPKKCFKKKDLNALAKSLKGRARNVRVLEDVRMT